MLAGKGSDVRHAVSHLTADGIETLEDGHGPGLLNRQESNICIIFRE